MLLQIIRLFSAFSCNTWLRKKDLVCTYMPLAHEKQQTGVTSSCGAGSGLGGCCGCKWQLFWSLVAR